MNGTHVKILQGISGSGKSTLAEKLKDENPERTRIVSADHYMIDKSGKYEFSFDKLDEAHRKCKERFIAHMTNSNVDTVIVDNTNTKIADMAFYAEFALTFEGNTVEVITLICDPRMAASRNVHNVPAFKVVQMDECLREEVQRLPKRWNPRVVWS